MDKNLTEKIADELQFDNQEDKEIFKKNFSQVIQGLTLSPDILKQYNEIIDSGAQWLLEYSEREQEHRHKIENRRLNYYIAGQIMGFLLATLGIGGGIYLATTDAAWFGFGVFFTSLVSLVGLFVVNKRSESTNNYEK